LIYEYFTHVHYDIIEDILATLMMAVYTVFHGSYHTAST